MQISYEQSLTLTYLYKESIQKPDLWDFYIRIGDYTINAGWIKNPYKVCEIYSCEKRLKFFDNFYLPIILGKKQVHPYKSVTKNYTEKQIQEILSTRFEGYCKDLRKKGVEILENNVKIYSGFTEATARGELTVLSPVGKKIVSSQPEIRTSPEGETKNIGE